MQDEPPAHRRHGNVAHQPPMLMATGIYIYSRRYSLLRNPFRIHHNCPHKVGSRTVPHDTSTIFLHPGSLIITMPIGENKNSGVAGGVTAVTSTIGNGVGGLLGTVGGVTGAAARGSESLDHVYIQLTLMVFTSRQYCDWSYRQYWKATWRCFGFTRKWCRRWDKQHCSGS